MFTVRYGAEQSKIFNSNCQILNLLHCIRNLCNYPQFEVDLAEETTGHLLHLRDSPYEYANTIIKPRMSYVLVHAKLNEDNTYSYFPLLDLSANNNPNNSLPNRTTNFVVKTQRPARTNPSSNLKTTNNTTKGDVSKESQLKDSPTMQKETSKETVSKETKETIAKEKELTVNNIPTKKITTKSARRSPSNFSESAV